LGGLDLLGDGVVVENILEGLGEPEENTNARIGDDFIGATRTGGESIDAATEDTEEMKVGFLTRADFVRGTWLITMDGNVVEA
jgi:hypothetical protein